ncbi:hypothetical protein [Aureicoccus marinus]|uniref:Uncharacterized protein n=1 Tax=Aureicoccus marinus TaxID=754435 RepID=A0A2S7T6Y7_9FLAO|nr:hypothetical protein [Aureicoccus marinus]PQJ15682.1 hypothetical protein BST99_08020 [Aureicoccus marinus]
MTKAVFIFFCFCGYSLTGFAQDREASTSYELLDWKVSKCEDIYNPYRLLNRIKEQKVSSGNSILSIHFSENCCAEIQPRVETVNDSLIISTSLPNEDDEVEVVAECDCRCSFTMELQIRGELLENQAIYLNDRKIEYSEDFYKTVPVSSSSYQGQEINRTNKYGHREGRWLTFNKAGGIEMEILYPESSLLKKGERIWWKKYSESGMLLFYTSPDSTARWNERGDLLSEIVNYQKGDTTFQRRNRWHENLSIHLRWLERAYLTTIGSERDTAVTMEIIENEYVYREEYYETGQPSLLKVRDTTFRWFPNGDLEELRYPNGRQKFYKTGQLESQFREWKEKGKKGQWHSEHQLSVLFDAENQIKMISYSPSDVQPTSEVMDLTLYVWQWDKFKNLISDPPNWEGPYPWSSIESIVNLLPEYELE